MKSWAAFHSDIVSLFSKVRSVC